MNAISPNSLVIFALFFVSLQTFSLDIGGNGVTANYVYVLTPFIFWFAGIKRRLVRRKEVMKIVLIYSLIYLIGFPGDILNLNSVLADPIRRAASFLVFLFPLFLSFVEFKPSDINIFKLSVIVVSVYYSLERILRFFSGVTDIYELKVLLGSQRYGFILCFGFFIVLFNDKLFIKKWILLQRILICSIILIGIIFTFSRASILSMSVGLVFSFISVLSKDKRRIYGIDGRLNLQTTKKKIKPIYLISTLILITSAFIIFQNYVHTDILSFYQQRSNVSVLLENTLEKDPESSEGFRYYVFIRILDYLSAHPLFGSNYQGLYLLFDEFKGGMSTHSQYTDVFLRTGLLGGTLWLFLLYRIFCFCGYDKGMQIGLVAIVIYGFFHETFKESQGSFVFGMLLSFSYMSAFLEQRRKLPALASLMSKDSS